MKTTPTFSCLLMGILLIGLVSTQIVNANNRIRTSAVFYQNNWIPCIDLKGVDIKPSISSGRACTISRYKNETILSVQLNEVKIYSSIDYNNKIHKKEDVTKANNLSIFSVQSESLQILRSKDAPIHEAKVDQTIAKNTEVSDNKTELAKAGFRKTFDHLLLFIIHQSKQLIENLASSWLNK